MKTNPSKSLLKNSLYNIFGTFCRIAFPVISFAYISRLLGEEGVGRVNFTRSIIAWFCMLAVLGTNEYGIREAARRRADRAALSRFAHEMLIISGCTTTIAYILLLFTFLLVPRLHGYGNLLLIFSPAILLQGLGMEWLYVSQEDFRYTALRIAAVQVAALVVLFLFVHDAGDTGAYAVVMVITVYGAYALNFFNTRKYVDWKWYGGYHIRQHLRPLLWLFAVAISFELPTVLDSTMLGFLQGDTTVGRYTAAVKVNKLINSLIVSVSAVAMPRLSFYFSNGEQEKVKELVNKAYNYIFMLSIPAAVGLFMLSNEIILLFSGRGFLSAARTMRILTPIVLLIPFSSSINHQTLVPMGKDNLVFRATLTGAITNFVCNCILIPLYAENGAAVATVLAETSVAAVCYMNARKYFDMKTVFRSIWQYWVAAAPIPLIAVLIKRWSVHYVIGMFVIIALSVMCYGIILLCLKNRYLLEVVQTVKDKWNRKKII